MSGINDLLLTDALVDPDISASISNFGVTLKSMKDLRSTRCLNVWELNPPLGTIKNDEYDLARKICFDENDSIVLYGTTEAVEGFLVTKKHLVQYKKQGGADQPPTKEALSRGPFWAVTQFNDVARGARLCKTGPLKNLWLYLDMSEYFKVSEVQARWNARTDPRPENTSSGTITRCVVYCSDGKAEMNL
jgi:hypothetical protein